MTVSGCFGIHVASIALAARGGCISMLRANYEPAVPATRTARLAEALVIAAAGSRSMTPSSQPTLARSSVGSPCCRPPAARSALDGRAD
jgi:hypothetical protein